jgi:hypothetical protein
MKKVVLMILCSLMLVGTAIAEETYSDITVFDMSISGTTTARNQSGNYSGVSWFATVDLGSVKPNMGIFSIQPYQITLADSNSGNVKLTASNSSGATYYLYYSVSNKNSENLWANAGVTPIGGITALSGSTTVVQGFLPEFAVFLRVGVLSGMTQFKTFKTTLAIQ